MTQQGYCANCGVVIYVEDRYMPTTKDTRGFTDLVSIWPPPSVQAKKLVAYMATETGPDICHCYHCGKRIRGAEIC